MRAVVYHRPGEIRVEEVERPTIGEGEALLRVRAASVCGTDLRIYSSGHFKIPEGTSRILGHELAGEVAEVGPKASGLAVGMRIGIAPNIGCGSCRQCVRGNGNLCPRYEAFGISLDGAFAEYMRIPAPAIRRGNIVPIPEGISYEEAALNEPFSCCYNGIVACNIKPGDAVLIVGAGPIGIMHLYLAKLSGARLVMVSEVVEERLVQVREFGADMVIDPTQADLKEKVMAATGGEGVDAVIVAAPSPEAQEQSLDLVAPQGRINFFGGLPGDKEFIRFNSNRVHYKQLVVTGTTGSNNQQYQRSMAILGSRRVDLSSLISARLPLDEAQEAFELAKSRKALKVLFTP